MSDLKSPLWNGLRDDVPREDLKGVHVRARHGSWPETTRVGFRCPPVDRGLRLSQWMAKERGGPCIPALWTAFAYTDLGCRPHDGVAHDQRAVAVAPK